MIAEAVEAITTAFTPHEPSDAEEYQRITAAIEALRTERGKIQDHGAPDDTRFGARLAALEGELAPIKARLGMAALHKTVAPEAEDQRVTEARADIADTERALASAQEALGSLRTKLGKLEREGASATERVKVASAISAAESDVRVAQHRVNDARQRVGVVVSLVQKEKQDAARGAVVAAASPLLSAAKAMLAAREVYIEARAAAAHAGMQAPAAPSGLTKERLAEFAQALTGLL